MKQIVYVFLLSGLIFNKVTAQEKQMNKEKIFKETKTANDASLQGHLEKNVTKICQVYADDAILLPPGAPEPIQGKEGIIRYYTEGLKNGSSLAITTENIAYEVIDERHANEVGRYTILYRANGSDKGVEIKGTMLICWEKNVKNEWKIKFDMWH